MKDRGTNTILIFSNWNSKNLIENYDCFDSATRWTLNFLQSWASIVGRAQLHVSYS